MDILPIIGTVLKAYALKLEFISSIAMSFLFWLLEAKISLCM